MEINELIKLKKQELAKAREEFYLKTTKLEYELKVLVEEKKLGINTEIDIIDKECKLPNGKYGVIKDFRISRKNANIICAVDFRENGNDLEVINKEFDLNSIILLNEKA